MLSIQGYLQCTLGMLPFCLQQQRHHRVGHHCQRSGLADIRTAFSCSFPMRRLLEHVAATEAMLVAPLEDDDS